MKKLAYVLFFVFFASCCASDEPEKVAKPLDIEMVFVEGGEYDKSAYPDKYPETESDKVQLDSYHIGKYEVTQAQWEAVMGYNPSGIIGASLPVNNVSWSDVRVFIKQLNSLTGKTYRLPSVAEWEFAARGGNQSKKFLYSGSDNVFDVAWCGENSGGIMHLVGSKQPNELGIYDMCGNVWEWCFTKLPGNSNPQYKRVLKGYSCRYFSDVFTLNFTALSWSNLDNSNLGFRIVLDSDQESGNDDVRVTTCDANISGENLIFRATVTNGINASSCGFLIGEDPNNMKKYISADEFDDSFSYSIYLYAMSPIVYYCAYAIDGWDMVKGEIKSINIRK